MNSAAPLVVEDLTFRYRDRQAPAIRGISFSAHPGEVLLIAGASGCGKTTLIRAINGLVPRSYKGEVSGKVLINGEDTAAWKLSTISQQVGTVLQDPERQILGTKVLNEVAFGLENLGLERAEITRAGRGGSGAPAHIRSAGSRYLQFVRRRKTEGRTGRCPCDAAHDPAA